MGLLKIAMIFIGLSLNGITKVQRYSKLVIDYNYSIEVLLNSKIKYLSASILHYPTRDLLRRLGLLTQGITSFTNSYTNNLNTLHMVEHFIIEAT